MPNQKTDAEFKEQVLALVNGDYTFLERYKNNATKIEVRHNICGHVYSVTPNHFLSGGRRCPSCYIPTRKRTQKYFEEQVATLGEGDYSVEGRYVNTDTKVMLKHELCGTVYPVKPYSFYEGNRCPKCKSSTGEKLIGDYLTSNNIHFVAQYSFKDCRNKHVLPFDFAVLDRNSKVTMLIEFDGLQHYQPIEYFGGVKKFEETKKHDNIKNTYCKNNDIKLIRIPYTEMANIESILKEVLNDCE